MARKGPSWESPERAPLLRDRNLVFLSERREEAWSLFPSLLGCGQGGGFKKDGPVSQSERSSTGPAAHRQPMTPMRGHEVSPGAVQGVHSPEQPLPQPPAVCLAVVPLYSLQSGSQICPFSPSSVSVHMEPARREGMRFL